MEEKKIESNMIYDGKILKVFRDQVLLPDGKTSFREYINHNGAAVILAEKDGYIYFVKQFRYAFKEEVLELPAGKLELNEDPMDCARRELSEETGLISDNIISYGPTYPSPGYTNEIIYLFMALDCKEGEMHLDEDEFLNVIKIKDEDVKKMMDRGEIKDGKSLILLYKYFDLRK